MKTHPKVIDQLATIVKVEPLSNGAAEVTFEYSSWGSRRCHATASLAVNRDIEFGR